MQPTNNINNPDGLDELLKQAFLDLDLSKAEDSRLMDEVAAQVMGSEASVAGKTTKNLRIKKAASAGKAWIWILSGVAGISVITLTAILLFGGTQQQNTVIEAQSELVAPLASASQNEAITNESTGPVAEEVVPATVSDETKIILRNEETVGDKDVPADYTALKEEKRTSEKSEIPAPVLLNASNEPVTMVAATTVTTKEKDAVSTKAIATDSAESTVAMKTESALPVLSAEELENHKKDLKTLDETFAGMKLSDYSRIEIDEKKPVIQGNFFLKKTEVTIKEYKLFLTDLLANGKVDEYNKAKPKLDNIWKGPKDKNSRAFLEMYFRKPKFENNPVICISTEAMEMYCQWIKERLESYYKRNNGNMKFTVRLPQIAEWKYVASEGNKRHRYGTSNGRLKERKYGIFNKEWNANFIETQQKFVAVGDSLVVVEQDKKQKIKTTSKLNKHGFIGPAHTYPTVKYDVFNMSGNVSEIVAYTDEKGNLKYRSIGGNWNSTANYLKIDAPDEFHGNIQPSPYIGFRPVIVLESK